MADPTNIEAIQAAKAQEAWLVVRMDAVQRLLAVLNPRPDDARMGYIALLQRARNALTKELQEQGMQDYA